MVVKAELISGTATVLLERGVREASSNLIRARHNRLTLTTGNPATRRAPHPTVGNLYSNVTVSIMTDSLLMGKNHALQMMKHHPLSQTQVPLTQKRKIPLVSLRRRLRRPRRIPRSPRTRRRTLNPLMNKTPRGLHTSSMQMRR